MRTAENASQSNVLVGGTAHSALQQRREAQAVAGWLLLWVVHLDTDAQVEAEAQIRTLEELRLQKVCRKGISRKEFYVPSSYDWNGFL